MKSQVLNNKGLNALRLILLVNLNASIIFLLIITIITLSGSEAFLPDERNLYGPLAGNMRIMLIYLCMTVITVYSYCRFSHNSHGLILMGGFLILLIASLQVYSMINQIPVHENYGYLLFYLGSSHILYGLIDHKDP